MVTRKIIRTLLQNMMRSSCRGLGAKLSAYLPSLSTNPAINLNRSFRSGGDSIVAMQFKATCHVEDVELTVRDILTCKSISELSLKARFGTSMEAGSGEVFATLFTLTPFQQMYLNVFQEYSPHDDHDDPYNQSLLPQLASATTVYRLARAFEVILQ